MVVIIYNIKSFYLHSFYTPLLSFDLFARTPFKACTHSAFTLSLATAASSVGNYTCLLNRTILWYSQAFLSCGSSVVKCECVWRHIASLRGTKLMKWNYFVCILYWSLRPSNRVTQKNGNFWKTQQKLKKSKKKKLLTEIEPLQLAF